jgi:hypothetical protein
MARRSRDVIVLQISNDLEGLISFDEWSAREYDSVVVDYEQTAQNLWKAGYRKKNSQYSSKSEKLKEFEDDLNSAITFDEWSYREYGNETIDFYGTALNLYYLGYRKRRN